MVEFEFVFVRITVIFLDSVVVVVVLVAIVDTIMPYYYLEVGQNFESQFFSQNELCKK